MAHRGAAPLIAALWLTGGCDVFYALGPNGCDGEHPCTNPDRPRCDVEARRCLAAEGGADLGTAAGADAMAEPDGPRCADHGDCPSGVCDELGLATAEPGRCLPEEAVAVVSSAGALRDALLLRRGVRLLAGVYEGDWVVALHRVVLVGPRARSPAGGAAELRPQSTGAVLRVGTRARVMVDGLVIKGGKGGGGHGLTCESADSRLAVRRSDITDNGGRGIWARCPLQVTQSRIGTWDGSGNDGGGVLAEEALSLTNSFINYNGTSFSDVGGVALGGAPTLVRALAHLTFVGNRRAGAGAAVDCGEATPTIGRSLFFDNFATHPLLGGGCLLIAAAIDDPAYQGPGSVRLSVANPPGFRGIFDLHLTAASAAKDTVPPDDPGHTLAVDYDGDPRPTGGGFDFGADEVVP